jgi:hypothetical protein
VFDPLIIAEALPGVGPRLFRRHAAGEVVAGAQLEVKAQLVINLALELFVPTKSADVAPDPLQPSHDGRLLPRLFAALW